MASAAKLQIDVDAKGVVKADGALDGLEKSAKKATKATRKLGGTTKKAATATEKLAKSTEDLKKKVKGLVATYLGLAAAVQAVSLVGEFEEATQTVKAIGQAANASTADLEALTAQTRELGASTRFTATQVAEAQVNLLRAGLASNEVLESTANVLNLATAAQLELARAAEIAAITQKQFGLEASESERIVDVLVATSNSAATTVEQLAEGLKFAAPVAAGFGATIEETAAALGVLSNAGLQASLAGTGLRGIFARLAAPTGKAAATIEKLAKASGQLSDDFNVTKRSLREVFLAFKKAEAGPVALLNIFGRLQAPAAISLTKAADELGTFEERLTGIAGEAKTTADIINDTLKKSFLDLQAALAELVLTINDNIGPAFRLMVEFGTDVVRAIAGVRDATGETNTVANILAVTLRLTADLLAALAIQWVAVRVQTIFAKTATLGFIGTLKGIKAAIASTGIGLFAVAFGELAVFIAGALEDTDEYTESLERQSKATDAVTEAVERNIKEIKKQNALLKGQLTPVQTLVARYNDILEANDKIRIEINSIIFAETEREIIARSIAETYALINKVTLESGATAVQASKNATDAAQKVGAALEIQFEVTKRLAELKGEVGFEDPNQKLINFLDKLRTELSDSSGFDEIDRRIEQLQQKFGEIADEDRGLTLDLDAFVSGLEEIDSLVRETASNKAFSKLEADSVKAGVAMQQAFEDAEAAVSAVGRDPSIQIAIEAQREFAEALQITEDLLAAQVARGDISREEADQRLETMQKLTIATAKLRQEELARNQALESQVALQAALQGRLDGAVETMRALGEASQFTTSAFDQFEDAAEQAITIYEERIRSAGDASGELQGAIDQITASIGAFAAEVQKQEVFEAIESSVVSTTRAFFDLFDTLISGSASAGEAFAAFIQTVTRALFEKFVVEQTIGAIQKALGGLSTVGGGFSAASGGLNALPNVTSAKGNAFDDGAITAFRHGGIIGGPTLFPLGLAGEAGPEAILPLSRGPDGRLGVQVSGAERSGRRPGANPFILRSVSPGASDAPTVQDTRGGVSRTVNIQQTIVTPDASSFRRSARQLSDLALASVRL